jgi:hypothetical protein
MERSVPQRWFRGKQSPHEHFAAPTRWVLSFCLGCDGAVGREIRRNRETRVLQSLAVYEDDALLVHLTYDANGNVRAAACNTRSVIEEDIKPCGFDGKPRRAITDVVNTVKELK